MISITPLKIKKIHIIGIGGIGMSGIADVLSHLGYTVQGSDQSPGNANTQRLVKKGMRVFFGHQANHIDEEISVVVHSTAIQAENPEIQAAIAQGIPVITRAEMLSELMRFYLTVAVSGTHGKTTTTSLIGHVMRDLSPTVINGGIINTAGSNVELGVGNWMVVEADESDGTFVRVPATISVVTNIDPEHLDYYGDFATLKTAFRSFVERVAFYGFAVLCYDHPVVREIALSLKDARIFTYGFHPNARVRAESVRETSEGMCFDVVIHEGGHDFGVSEIKNILLPLYGKHNVLNALAAMTVGLKMGIAPEQIRSLLSSYQGVQRRFTETERLNGVRYIDDYAHHPTEIKAVIQAARGLTKGQIIVVFQPHRYSRLQSLFQDFLTALSLSDYLLVTPVYAGGETALPGITSQKVVEAYRTQYSKACALVQDPSDVMAHLKTLLVEGDLVLFLGAGDITKWAYAVPTLMKEYSDACA
jgi:UDP-N-acetylmuramate--alanine ligase